MPKAYEPQNYEDAIYSAWEESGFFNPDHLEGEPFSVMMPPPNVTGVLHLGHALENSLMDIMIRYQRMCGKKTLLVPGTDHAAVATQARVEKNLVKEGHPHPREEFGREKLLEMIRAYAEQSKGTILTQIRKMGTSADWSRLAYTFDEARSKAVTEVFVKMYQDGLIYRGHRVVNWSVKGQSTCSDDELVYVDRPAKLYTFKYSSDFPFTIATTRPETKLGDTAVAVHPSDERYQKYLGQTFEVNFCGVSLKLRVIADEGVDPLFGTGALGVTPAHSGVDFEMYEKQKALGEEIALIEVIGTDGHMTTQTGERYEGLSVEEAREKVVACLKEQGLLVSEEEIEQSVGSSDRFGDVVEAIPLTQWFVAVNKEIPGRGKTLKELMKEAVTVGHQGDPEKKVRITPERFEKSYYSWIDHLRDWCISRQIWWGHRIPVWYRGEEVFCGKENPEGDGWTQDPDTLDTWFSSGLWTFSTLGWPEQTNDFRTFYPTTWMQMGYEILFFWMARMILMSTYVLDEIPFKDVYIHGMLRDKDGQKFSKSLGNGIDPIEVVNKYGADALRFSLIAGVSPGNDAKFYEEKVEAGQHLVNKLWNISRFVLTSVENVQAVASVKPQTAADQWILSRFSEVVEKMTLNMKNYEFSAAGELLRDFTWNDFADWYLEIAKGQRQTDKEKTDAILLFILERLLVLWHPFMPFVTEEIWKQFETDTMMIIHPWVTDLPSVEEGENKFTFVQDCIVAIRNLRAQYKVEPAKFIEAVIVHKDKALFLREQEALIKQLARINILKIEESAEQPEGSVSTIVGDVKIFVPLAGLVDGEKEKAKLEKERQEVEQYLASLEQKLSNRDFLSKAPEQVVESLKEKKKEAEKKLNTIIEQINFL
ncbi:MAG: Valine-tRNA ligase [Candidatus Uhrbacteria bacterium GW2011_GWE2_40_58]|nr:MAG: Valine-tRNA ligase [Candidatus Uhrbacteria bacterium GW2011_GWF2_40_263]KKR67481.1 MAG: Valine-tRNA ligase [Candidatus Uhrbacteria bacterium GW2011_GWE2_40_58]